MNSRSHWECSRRAVSVQAVFVEDKTGSVGKDGWLGVEVGLGADVKETGCGQRSEAVGAWGIRGGGKWGIETHRSKSERILVGSW